MFIYLIGRAADASSSLAQRGSPGTTPTFCVLLREPGYSKYIINILYITHIFYLKTINFTMKLFNFINIFD